MFVTRGEAGPGHIESVTESDVKMSVTSAVTSEHTMGQDQSSLRGVSGVSLMLFSKIFLHLFWCLVPFYSGCVDLPQSLCLLRYPYCFPLFDQYWSIACQATSESVDTIYPVTA